MTAFTSIFISILTFFMSLIAPLNSYKAPEDKSGFVPVVRFMVMSDTHIDAAGDKRCSRIQKILSLGYSDAEQDENYKKLDAVMFCGDVTDNGRKDQFDAFKATVDSCKKDETQVLALLAQAHDCSTMKKDALSFFSQITGLDTDWHYVINGYHFIGVSTSKEPDVRYSQYQIDWMKQQLAEAAADDPSKPIFVAHHEHILNTVYGSAEGEWGDSTYKEIFSQYPQIVFFSGHSHYPVNDPRSIWQGDFTAVGTGSVNYMEFTVDGVSRLHPDDNKKTGQAWIVEVSADNKVRLRGFDVYSETLLCEYILENVADVNSRQFTPEQNENASSAPAFADGASLKVSGAGKNVTVTVPAAESTDGWPVFLYRAVAYDKDGNEVSSAYKQNNYWLYPCLSSVKIVIELPEGGCIKVFAENAYGQRSEALEYSK